MPSLLQLPQNIWRDNVVYFLPKVEDLARLDSAIANASDRATFHANISGCKRFITYDKSSKVGKLQWLVVRKIMVNIIHLGEEPRMEDVPYINQLLLHARCMSISKDALSQSSDVLHWACSATLETLHIYNCQVVDISGISSCSNLLDLDLYNCPHLTEASFMNGIGGCEKLLNCYVHHCTNLLAAAVAAVLGSCVQLRDLNLSGNFDLQEAFALFRSESNLKTFSYSDPNRTACLTGCFVRAMATALPELIELDLDYPQSTVVDADMEFLARGCKSLTLLNLQYTPHVTNLGVISLARCLAQLKTLYLNHLTITDTAVQAVGTHCRVLQSLDVCHCSLLTDAAFSTLNVTCLKYLSVSGTRVIGSFASYILSPQSALETFSCGNCEHLNADFLHSLACNTTVTLLRIGKNLLTEGEWLKLSTLFPKLRILTIRNAAVVNDAIALSFYTHCPQLRSFLITDCNVSPEVMEQVKRKY